MNKYVTEVEAAKQSTAQLRYRKAGMTKQIGCYSARPAKQDRLVLSQCAILHHVEASSESSRYTAAVAVDQRAAKT